MTFWSDPEHLWIAVLISALVTVSSTAIFALVVKVLLDQFLKAQREILTSAIIQTDSVDEALRQLGLRITGLGERVTKLEKHRDEHNNKMVAFDERLRRVEPR